MKLLLLALLVSTTSVFAQQIKVKESITEITNIQKKYETAVVIHGTRALVAKNGSIMSPGIPDVTEKRYVGYDAKTQTISSPTALESDCLNMLKENFLKARTSLGYKTVKDLGHIGISEVNLVVISDMDKNVDTDIKNSLLEIAGVKGRSVMQIALLHGTKCYVQSSADISKSLSAKR